MSNVEAIVWAIPAKRNEDGTSIPGFYPNPTAKFVAAALARRAWATGRVGWSQTGLSRDTSLSPRTIWTALKDLEEVGLIKREPVYRENLRRADRLIFTLPSVTLSLEPMEDGDLDPAFADVATRPPVSQNLRGERVATSARRKPRTSKTSEAKASSSRAKTSKPKKMHLVPDDWEPKDAHREKVSAFGWPDGIFEEQLARFREWEFAAGKTDFDRAFHRWLRTHNDDLKGRTNDDRAGHYRARSGTGGGLPSRGERIDAMRAGALAALDRHRG